jgi:hypothetical protein
VIPPETATTDGLLTALRCQANQPAIAWSVPPARLAGGFWAEMYVIELTDPPRDLDGCLVARIMPDPATAAFETAMQGHLTRWESRCPRFAAATGRAATSIARGG